MFPDFNVIEALAEELKIQYKNTPGIISIRVDSFIGDSIVIAIDASRLVASIPKQYKDIPIVSFDVYQNYKSLSDVIDDLVVNEPSLWDSNATLENLVSMCESYKKIIKDYEKEIYNGR